MGGALGLVRRLAERWLPDAAYRTIVDIKHLIRPPGFLQRTYSQEGEELIIRRFFQGHAPGFYVDVGAHEPRRFSNTHFLYRAGWRGVDIDANPECVARLAKERHRDVCVNVGVGPASAELSYFMFDAWELNTFDRDIAAQREREGHPVRHTRQVPVRPLADLLAETVPVGQAIDLLTIDVEGLDLAVLESNDWSRFVPRLVLVEIYEKALRLMLDSPLARFMLDRGYVPVAKTFNTLFFGDSKWIRDGRPA